MFGAASRPLVRKDTKIAFAPTLLRDARGTAAPGAMAAVLAW